MAALTNNFYGDIDAEPFWNQLRTEFDVYVCFNVISLFSFCGKFLFHTHMLLCVFVVCLCACLLVNVFVHLLCSCVRVCFLIACVCTRVLDYLIACVHVC